MVFKAEDIKKSYGSLRAVDGVSFSVLKGETLGIVGESGCGKTTLAKIMVGLIDKDSGRIESKAKVQMVFQDPYSSLDPLFKVQDILNEAFYAVKITAVKRQEEIVAALKAVGLDASILSRYPHEFSGGQRQRIAIARALLTKPEILILDEPTSALDVLVQKQIIDLLGKLKARLGLTYIFISHNLRVVKSFSDKILVMYEGKVVESGDTKKVISSPQHPYTKNLLSAALNYE